MIKAIIFDMDGVIVDSFQLHLAAWKKLGEEYGFGFKQNYIEKLNGMDTLSTAEFFVREYSLDADPAEIADRKKKLVAHALQQGASLFSGVKTTLRLLKRLGYKLGLGTSNTKKGVELSLGASIADIEFDAIVTDSDVMNAKPAPDIYIRCSEMLGVRPEECIVVEDAKNGITAAKRAGMIAVGITNTSSADVFSDADAVISGIKELNEGLIRKLEGKE